MKYTISIDVNARYEIEIVACNNEEAEKKAYKKLEKEIKNSKYIRYKETFFRGIKEN